MSWKHDFQYEDMDNPNMCYELWIVNLTLKPNENKLLFVDTRRKHNILLHIKTTTCEKKRSVSLQTTLGCNWKDMDFQKRFCVSFSLIGLFYGYKLTQSVELVLWKNISCEKFSYTFLLYKSRLHHNVQHFSSYLFFL